MLFGEAVPNVWDGDKDTGGVGQYCGAEMTRAGGVTGLFPACIGAGTWPRSFVSRCVTDLFLLQCCEECRNSATSAT
jgi:hypothetical protein